MKPTELIDLLAEKDPREAAARTRRLARERRGAAAPAEMMPRMRASERARRLVALVCRIDGMRRAGEDGAARAEEEKMEAAMLAELRHAAAACSDEEKIEALMIAVRGEMADVAQAIRGTGLGATCLRRIFTHCSVGMAARIGMDPLETMRQALELAVTRAGVRRALRCRLGLACLARLEPHVASANVAVEAFEAAVDANDAESAALYYEHWPAERERMRETVHARPGTACQLRAPFTLDQLIRAEFPLRRGGARADFMEAALRGDLERAKQFFNVYYPGLLLDIPMRCYHPAVFCEMARRGYDWVRPGRQRLSIQILLHRPDQLCARMLGRGMYVEACNLITRIPPDAVAQYVGQMVPAHEGARDALRGWIHERVIMRPIALESNGMSDARARELTRAIADGLTHPSLTKVRRRMLAPLIREQHLALILASKHRGIRLPPELHQYMAENFLA